MPETRTPRTILILAGWGVTETTADAGWTKLGTDRRLASAGWYAARIILGPAASMPLATTVEGLTTTSGAT
jgi:hypothetical protein